MDEGELIMRQRDLQRLHVVRLTLKGRERVRRGAELLGLSVRQVKRLRQKMRELGVVEGLLHGNRGRKPWNSTARATIKKCANRTRVGVPFRKPKPTGRLYRQAGEEYAR
jgi:hypothetical protein